MLSCKEISELASDHIDHKLPFFKRMQFRMHLFMCHKCRQFVEQMQLTIDTISQIKPLPPEPSQVDDQVAKLMEISRSNTDKS